MRKVTEHYLKFSASVLALVVAASVAAADTPLTTQVVDALNKVYGVHPGFRANHAKGVVVEGHFKALPGAAQLSRAALFNGSSIPVTVRFSDSGGVPNIPDGSGDANRSAAGVCARWRFPIWQSEKRLVQIQGSCQWKSCCGHAV